MTHNIVANLEYVMGHLRYGYLHLNLDEDEYQEFMTMSKEEKKDFIWGKGDIIIDDYEIDDTGDIDEVYIDGKRVNL
jgi:hypothetical protein